MPKYWQWRLRERSGQGPITKNRQKQRRDDQVWVVVCGERKSEGDQPHEVHAPNAKPEGHTDRDSPDLTSAGWRYKDPPGQIEDAERHSYGDQVGKNHEDRLIASNDVRFHIDSLRSTYWGMFLRQMLTYSALGRVNFAQDV